MALMSEIADDQKMNEIRSRVSSIVQDPKTAGSIEGFVESGKHHLRALQAQWQDGDIVLLLVVLQKPHDMG
jgi:hypothetical protein